MQTVTTGCKACGDTIVASSLGDLKKHVCEVSLLQSTLYLILVLDPLFLFMVRLLLPVDLRHSERCLIFSNATLPYS